MTSNGGPGVLIDWFQNEGDIHEADYTSEYIVLPFDLLS
jgi:hypothetical protein